MCCAPDFWQQRLNLLARRLHLSRPVTLLESCLARVPVVIGYIRPVILMPVGLLTGMPAGQLESILLHELAHIRRYDYLVNLLQTSVEGLLFYHPAVWWISGVIRTEREHCCDDLAVSLSGDAREYATALATLEQCRWDAAETALAATGGNIVKRIRRLLIPTEGPSSALTPFVSAGILMITAAVGLTAWQAELPQHPTRRRRYPLHQVAERRSRVHHHARGAHRVPALQTDAERQHFIVQFWKNRDPTPDTPENEFKDEHYRRIAYANFDFQPRPARPAGKPTADASTFGSDHRTKSTIILPLAQQVPRHSGRDRVPYIDWTYRFIEGVGTNVRWSLWTQPGTHDFQMTLDPIHPPDR